MELNETGYENIFPIGMLHGYRNSQIREKIDDIVEFAELGEHYTPAEQVGLLFHLALTDGFTRMARVFDSSEETS